MMIPNQNINAYRSQYQSNNRDQLVQIICNEDIRNPRFIGMQRATIVGVYDEGAFYRGYGSYYPNAICNANNIYSPIYYNSKSSFQGQNDDFIQNANQKLTTD